METLQVVARQSASRRWPDNAMVPSITPNGSSADMISAGGGSKPIQSSSPVNTFTTTDWLTPNGVTLAPLHQQATNAMIFQPDLAEMQRFQQERQWPFASRLDYTRLDAESLLFNSPSSPQSDYLLGVTQQQSHFLSQSTTDAPVWVRWC